MPGDPAAPAAASTPAGTADAAGNGAGRAADLAELRRLLVGPEQRELDALWDRIDALGLTADELADLLPEAIALRTSRDQQLGRALAPTVETALSESIRRNPREIATAIFPVLGPAIRKAIAETMAGLVRSINTAVEHSFSIQGIRWRLESWRTGVPFPEIVLRHALVYRVEQVFLIHGETGLLLVHVSAPDLKVPEADLISGMLTAIQDFVRDSFRPQEGGILRTFSVGDHTVHVEAGPAALLAAVVRGQAPDEFVPRLQYALESVHLQFASQLADFSGDAAPFEPARPILADCLETVVETRRGKPAGRLWLRWVIPLALLLLLGAGLVIRSGLRWRRVLAALDAEPGLVVLRADRGWGGWRIDGLRDPGARDPAEVVQAAVGVTGLQGRWQPYLSLDSAMVVTRARTALALPAGVAAELRNDTLVLAGTAPLNWLPVGRAAGRPPGVAGLLMDDVRLQLPPGLDSVLQSLTGSLVQFDPGSASLTPAASATVARMAAGVRQLVAGVTGAGAAIRIELVGRTDPSGTDLANRDLAQRRIERVAARFREAGIAEAVLAARPLATDQPLPSPDPAERARINRSVAVQFTVASRPFGGGTP